MYARVLIVSVLSFVCVECAILSGKALYCRDPDSGKLHAVNTTWASSSFCGNYTCKLRKRNATKDEPIRQFNITNIKQNANKTAFELGNAENVQPIKEDKNLFIDNMIDIEKQLKYYEDKISNRHDQNYESNKNKATYTELNRNNEAKPQTTPSNLIHEFQTLTTKMNEQNDEDRYLNEYEIQAITNILRTVKKSDLYALIDIYHLANDIYKEMGNAVSEDFKDETTTTSVLEKGEKKSKKAKKSYWYDSLASKGKIQDIEPLGSKDTLTTSSGINNEDLPDFNKALSHKELSKLPFYYPISDFQRFSSYKHVPNNKPNEPVREVPKTTEKDNIKYIQKKEIQRSYLLPYPFAYINHYNVTDLPSFYYNNPSWRADYYNRYRYYQPYYNAFIAQIPNGIVYSDEVQDIEQRPMNKHELDKINKKPEWKTDPIPREEIEDIRANVDTSKFLSFPLRKLVKLDTVGKLSKMTISEESYRSKRSPEYNYNLNVEDINGDDGDYETYVEKITCTHQTDLGFFRMGNTSQPFPKCCPQLIKTVHNVNKIF